MKPSEAALAAAKRLVRSMLPVGTYHSSRARAESIAAEALEAFAAEAVARERERCAKLCEADHLSRAYVAHRIRTPVESLPDDYRPTCAECGASVSVAGAVCVECALEEEGLT